MPRDPFLLYANLISYAYSNKSNKKNGLEKFFEFWRWTFAFYWFLFLCPLSFSMEHEGWCLVYGTFLLWWSDIGPKQLFQQCKDQISLQSKKKKNESNKRAEYIYKIDVYPFSRSKTVIIAIRKKKTLSCSDLKSNNWRENLHYFDGARRVKRMNTK